MHQRHVQLLREEFGITEEPLRQLPARFLELYDQAAQRLAKFTTGGSVTASDLVHILGRFEFERAMRPSDPAYECQPAQPDTVEAVAADVAEHAAKKRKRKAGEEDDE